MHFNISLFNHFYIFSFYVKGLCALKVMYRQSKYM